MSTVVTSPKTQILALVNQMTISEKMFADCNAKITQTLATKNQKAKKPEWQPLLDKCYQVYLEAVQKHQLNLKAQYELGQTLIRQIQTTDDLATIPPLLINFQATMNPLLAAHRQLQDQITTLENQIVGWLPENTRLSM